MNSSNFSPGDKENPGEIPETGIEAPARPDGWAMPTSRFKVYGLPADAININVEGRQVVGPLQGFGQLWQKTYKVRLVGDPVTPEEVIRVWKQEFSDFWPKGNRFYPSLCGIAPGEVAVLNLAGPGGITGPRGMPLISTGVLVIYADDDSFSFMTPEGHMFAAMITFSAYREDDSSVAQVQALVRSNDPIYEMSFRLGFGHKAEDQFWQSTLLNLAKRFGVNGYVQQDVILVDPRVQWSKAKNIWHNAAVRTGIYVMMTPLRWLRNVFSS